MRNLWSFFADLSSWFGSCIDALPESFGCALIQQTVSLKEPLLCPHFNRLVNEGQAGGQRIPVAGLGPGWPQLPL